MMERQPIGYESDHDEKLTGLRLHHADSGEESTLAVDLTIEAMGLEIDSTLAGTLANHDLVFTANGLVEISDSFRTHVENVYAAGGMTNGGASVGQCVAEGMKVAKVIHTDFS